MLYFAILNTCTRVKQRVRYQEDITPLARNEWICWIIDAKKPETRTRRINIMLDKFFKGERRPCCWAGCKANKSI